MRSETVGISETIILIAEDDERSRAALRQHLQTAGYQVVEAADGEAALLQFERFPVDLIILDVLMPKMTGLEVCQWIRQQSDVPIIIVTVLGSADDRVAGLEMGANDYMVKPFSGRELVARIRAILRRTQRHHSPQETEGRSSKLGAHGPKPYTAIQAGVLTIDAATRRVYKNGQLVRLTEIEFHILRLLASEPNRIFSRAEILQQIWGYASSDRLDTKTVDVHISRLRIKLEDGKSASRFIMTIHGRGYTFVAQG
ncbi:MAG: response regulator [Cyanobacteria bacterium J06632_22]